MSPALVALVLAVPWPGETAAQAVDLTPLVPGTSAGFGQQVSDLYWNPATRTLWVARAPGGVWALVESGGSFAVQAAYPAINADSEGITQVGSSDPHVFVLDETGGLVRKYFVAGDGGAVLVRTWNLAGVVPPQVGNAGPEGLAFVADEALRDAGLPVSGFDAGGVFLVAHQNGGFVYVVDLDPASDTGRTAMGRITTSRTESSALAFDRGRLYVSHNTGTNWLEVGVLGLGADGGPAILQSVELDSPNTFNLEGFALTAQGDGPQWCFWADDDGNSVGRPGLMWFRQLPPTLAIAAGNGQTAVEGTAVAVAPSVLLRDAFGSPFGGQVVTFDAGTGSVTGGAPMTSLGGIGTVGSWILGAAGPQSLSASALGRSVVFTATVVAADAGTIDAGVPTDGGSGTGGGGGSGGTGGGSGTGGDSGTGGGTGTMDGGPGEVPLPRGCGCGATPDAWPLLALLAAAWAVWRRSRPVH